MSTVETDDSTHMARALAVGRRGLGRTRPNPPVGAVVVRAEEILGEGWHRRAGGRHAEILALDAAGDGARGATVFVTLEPCAHRGRTPPCTEALIEAGVRRVVYGARDLNPEVPGGGHQRLTEAGIEVTGGVRFAESYRLAQPFFQWARHHRPLVLAKFAMSLDGKIATASGDARWISNRESRRRGHELRDTHDAILVGAGTVRADDPSLTARLEGGDTRHPVRIVVDTRASTAKARVFSGELPGQSVMATTRAAAPSVVRSLEASGHEVWLLPAASEGGVDLEALLARAASAEITSILVEGGGTLLGSLFDRDLVDRVAAFVAPMVIGGVGAAVAVAGRGVDRLADARRVHDGRVREVSGDVWLEGELRALPATSTNENEKGD